MMSERGRRLAHEVLSRMREWSAFEGIDARIIDRASAKFLAELDEPACPRCGSGEIYRSGPYCRPCYNALAYDRRKKSKDGVTPDG